MCIRERENETEREKATTKDHDDLIRAHELPLQATILCLRIMSINKMKNVLKINIYTKLQ